MNVYDVIRRPLATEKTYVMRSEGTYAFEIHPEANKHQVKEAVEKVFEVHVVAVNVMNIPGKRRRAGRRWIVSRAPMRKAVVRLAQGQTIRALETGV